MKRLLLVLVILLCGCESVILLSWKPTVISTRDSERITATASPNQPVNFSDITGLPTP